jgi:hypothetical protein
MSDKSEITLPPQVQELLPHAQAEPGIMKSRFYSSRLYELVLETCLLNMCMMHRTCDTLGLNLKYAPFT